MNMVERRKEAWIKRTLYLMKATKHAVFITETDDGSMFRHWLPKSLIRSDHELTKPGVEGDGCYEPIDMEIAPWIAREKKLILEEIARG